MVQQVPIIVADSTVSLPYALIQDLPLIVVPLEIHHQGDVYFDGVDLTPTQFYQLIKTHDTLPTTSAPQPGSFLAAFQKAAQLSDTIICITISKSLSAAHDAAHAGKEMAKSLLPATEIIIIDSKTAGTAEGLIALQAARAAKTGIQTNQIIEMIGEAINRVTLIGYLDTLYYVWKGGRVPRAQMWMGHILGFKPILQLSAGHIGMIERPRTRDRAQRRLLELTKIQVKESRTRIAVVHANAIEQAHILASIVKEQINPLELILTEFTPVIGVHTGPGLVGLAVHPLD